MQPLRRLHSTYYLHSQRHTIPLLKHLLSLRSAPQILPADLTADKNPSPDAAALFHTLTTVYCVLGDVVTKAAYDQGLVARLVRKRKSEAMDVRRRRMCRGFGEECAAAAATGGFLGAKRQKMDEEEKRLEALREEGARLKMSGRRYYGRLRRRRQSLRRKSRQGGVSNPI